MTVVDIRDLASIGLVKDRPGYTLTPEAFTKAMNVRFVEDKVKVLAGDEEIIPGATVTPLFMLPVYSGLQFYILYASLTDVAVWDGIQHTTITRASGGYNTSEGYNWNGGVIVGTPFLNNGLDIPQYWASYSPSQKLQDLPNWPTTKRAKVLRAFDNFMIALGVTENGVLKPRRVLWSHPAEPGALPISWDVSDTTKLAGQVDLIDDGVILDGRPLNGRFYIYNDRSTTVMSHIGGVNVFRFDTFLQSSGIIAPRCLGYLEDGRHQFVVTQDNIIVHDGSSVTPLLDARLRRWLFDNIAQELVNKSFVFSNPKFKEMWFCYPAVGSSVPNRALIWNYERGVPGVFSEADVQYTYATSGSLEDSSSGTWDSSTDTWDTIVGNWSKVTNRQTLGSRETTGKIYGLDVGLTRDGAAYTSTLERKGMSLAGKVIDHRHRKLLNRLWLSGTGGNITVRLGKSDQMDGAITWNTAKTFNPSTDRYIDDTVEGVELSLELSSSGIDWSLFSYHPDVVLNGEN